MRLLLDVTAHGFGHLAQCAPVIDRLRRAGALQLIVRSGIPLQILRDRLGPIDRHIASDTDFGAVMLDAAAVDRAATAARYRALHARLPDEIRALADTLRDLRCDVVLSNVSYIAPAAAAAAGIPCVLFSSLTWHEVVRACCPEASDLADAMLAAYRQATRVLRLVPGTEFTGLGADAVMQPIARVGRARRRELAERIGLAAGEKLALLAFGGMLPSGPPPLAQAPGEFRLLGPSVWQPAGIIPVDAAGLPFQDLLASADIVISKPGYGIVTELACCGTPSLLAARPDWPEEPRLSSWLALHTRCNVVARWQDVTADALRNCLDLPAPLHARPDPGGEEIVAAAVRAVAQSAEGQQL